ncbi:tRNA(Ile)(2)-agmatinylcytidine synthase [Natrialba sp. SSL1]|uniref:tRNA(Ile)(2)-agmatinylcytidine synthase n=1 Tax=Natrialba sp. SSL1 TaxID=1869245 RepID=UPI0008F92086|nr:tRNA(Ile)(2)-agmatinylcytidine synthase [Natrialba sp. SSL1]OIB55797.1 tRNA(Ile2) 2-agmatinylcytidine synthetase [Natrialba sp. SSL1]
MTIVGLDDTDSREHGMCTTYVAARVAKRLRREADAAVARTLLVRLNPAVEYKTRGNAALAIHTDCDPARAFDIAREVLESLAETRDERTNPGLVVADVNPDTGEDAIPVSLARFSMRAIRDHLSRAGAEALIDDHGYQSWHAGNGRGRIGAVAAIGAWRALSDWTYEQITYREPERWGTTREVDHDSVFAAAASGYPDVWDTVDRGENETVCVPHTPGPILHGIRGDDPQAVRRIAEQIDSEPVYSSHPFVTNQGTDVHLRDVTVGADSDSGTNGSDTGAATATPLQDGRAYRLDARVVSEPETRRGGHVFVDVAPEGVAAGDADNAASSPAKLPCAAFEPTKRFRDHVRALRPGDRLTVCGELADGTLKLEKVAVRGLNTTDLVTPVCPDCERTMESAGRDQGYRCRDCGTDAPGKERTEIERVLELGWYEVPPCARRHIAKPLVRGGFDGPVHPER